MGAEIRADARAEVTAEVTAEGRTKVRSEMGVEVRAEARGEVKAEARAKARREAGSEAKAMSNLTQKQQQNIVKGSSQWHKSGDKRCMWNSTIIYKVLVNGTNLVMGDVSDRFT